MMSSGVAGDARADKKADKAAEKAAEKAEKAAEKQACIDAHSRGQALVRDGKLHDAREQFIACGRESCPGAIRKDCAQWLGEANEQQPSVVIGAKDDHGKDTVKVRVLVDGNEVQKMLDGRPIELDPGTHSFHYVLENKKTLDEQVLIRQGEKNRKLTAVFPRVQEPPKPFEIPTAGYVLGGVAIGAIGNFVAWAIVGKNQQSELESSCAPRCPQEDADAMRRDYALADVSLGLALVAAGAAVAITLISNRPEQPPPGQPPLGWRLRPAGTGLAGSF